MSSNLHTFDPDGDLVLILSKPQKTTDTANQKAPENPTGPTKKKRKRGAATHNALLVEAEKVCTVVSSKHLILASPIFKVMLSGRFREGLRRNAAGQMEVDLPDDDHAVMTVVLNLIHGRNRLVPKQVDLEMLTRLATLVDKYQMIEAVESLSDVWIDNLLAKEKLPGGNGINQKQCIQRWIAVAWVFRREKEFSKITAAAMICYGSNLTDGLDRELSIPQKILGGFSSVLHTSGEANLA
jgi:hypothetical protein